MSTKTKKDILSDEDFDPRNIKQRISIMLDLDLLDALKAEAKKQGTGYQTLINKSLREKVFNEKSLEKRVSDLEKALLKKRA